MHLCPADQLRAYVRQVALAMGAGADIADELASHLVRANLSGHDSHGVLRLPQYVQQADNGGLVPFGGARRFLGTNPWSFGVPADGPTNMVYDAATSTVAEGKLRVARSKGAALAPGLIVDKQGNPSTNAMDFYEGGALLPVGGDVAGHKGYGLSMASVLIAGLSMVDDDSPRMPVPSAQPGDGHQR